MTKGTAAVAELEPTNGAEEFIEMQEPYIVRATLQGSADILLHAWNVEAVQEKAESKKGSKAKKTDNLESYVVRRTDGKICIPGTYVRGALVAAAKFRQDPRSPRKSAQDLYKAAIHPNVRLFPLRNLAGEIPSTWDFIDKQRVTVQRQGLTRWRPGFVAGWEVDCELMCILPEYIRPEELHDVLTYAGMVAGLGDFRPTYGRFRVTSFEVDSTLSAAA